MTRFVKIFLEGQLHNLLKEMANVNTVFIFVVLVNCWFVENFVQAEMNAETVFEFLSRRLDNMLIETALLKSRVHELESQCKANKNEEITKVTESTHLVDRKVDTMANEREVMSMKKNAQAVHKMMYVEKRLIRETLEKFNDRFEVLEPKITEKMAMFDEKIEDELLNMNASLDFRGRQMNDDINQIKENTNDELLKMNASLEVRGRQMHDFMNDLSIKAKKNITQMTIGLQVASDELVMKFDSHIREQKARVEDVELRLNSTREAMSVMEARLTRVMDEKFSYIPGRIWMVEVGDRVKRGRDWKWGNQDGNGIGTVIAQHESRPGWIRVQWDVNKSTNSYRNGAEDSYDLRII